MQEIAWTFPRKHQRTQLLAKGTPSCIMLSGAIKRITTIMVDRSAGSKAKNPHF
jgi:hypothetical protein